MFTKTILSLALIMGTTAGAFAADGHVAASPVYGKYSARAMERSELARRDRVGFVVGNMIFVGFHEMGHALADQLRLPLLGRSEDAADSFAAIALLEEGSGFSVNVLVQAARGLFLMDRRDRRQGDPLDFSDEHGLERQRAFQIICFMVGSDPSKFKDLANSVRLPDDRQRSCRTDYEVAKDAWHLVLDPHLRSPDQPRAPIEISYQQGAGKLQDYARSFQAIALLEALAEYVSDRYLVPHPIRLVMESCGDPNARWDPSTLTGSFCYELAEDFGDLYRGHAKRAIAREMQGNRLIAGNLTPTGRAHDASKANLEAGAGLPDAFETRHSLEKLALDLEDRTPSLFTQTGNR
jgi:hypothetical protein